MEVIRRVDKPTDWVNASVMIEKPKSSGDPEGTLPTTHNRRDLPVLKFPKLDANHGYT